MRTLVQGLHHPVSGEKEAAYVSQKDILHHLVSGVQVHEGKHAGIGRIAVGKAHVGTGELCWCLL